MIPSLRDMNTVARHTCTVLIMIIASMTAASCAVSEVSDGSPESKTFRLTGEVIDLRSDLGSLEVVPVEPAPGQDHQVRVTRWFKASKSAGQAKADWSQDGDDTIRLSAVCSGVIVDCELRHRVEVPAGVPIKITADSGNVVANDFAAALEIEVADGNINVDRASGRLKLTARDGSMRAERLTSEQVSARTGDGYVILEFDQAPKKVNTRSTNGNTTIRLPEARYSIKTDLADAKSTIKVDKDSSSDRRISAAVTDGRLRIESASR